MKYSITYALSYLATAGVMVYLATKEFDGDNLFTMIWSFLS